MILYVTFDGLLEPLGASQIVRPLRGLAQRGLRYHVLSLEKPRDLSDPTHRAALAARLSEAGIGWTSLPYAVGGTKRDVLGNVARMTRKAAELVRRLNVELVHARSYLAGGVALTVKSTLGVPYLFDFRGYWVDEQKEERRWVTNPWAYRGAKLLERQLFQGAIATVSLTELASEDIRAGRFGAWDDRPAVTIPTCADFGRFALRSGDAELGGAIGARLRDKLVITYCGSINASYSLDASLRLFTHVRRLRADAHLLCITQQSARMSDELARAGVAGADATVTSVAHDDIPEWLALAHWGLLILSSSPAKRASMPTKLAEFFATGVRPIQFGCNEEVGAWVRRARSGCVLRSTDDDELARAARVIATDAGSAEVREEARSIAASHFSLDAGVARYAALIRSLERTRR